MDQVGDYHMSIYAILQEPLPFFPFMSLCIFDTIGGCRYMKALPGNN
jgi:hypothetical protein